MRGNALNGAAIARTMGPATMPSGPDVPPRARPHPLRALAFPMALVGLAAIAFASLRTPPRIVTGLPDDPEAARVRALVHGRLRVESGGLRFVSALLGEPDDAGPPAGIAGETAGAAGETAGAAGRAGAGSAAGAGSPARGGARPSDTLTAAGSAPASRDSARAAAVALAVEAARRLEPARRRRPNDPRLLAALGCLSLAAHRHAQAERLYRRALDLAPTYGEARLGLGTTLSLRAAAEGDPERARGLRLRAISQFAAVQEGDPCSQAARYDRALLLARAGRAEEARRRAWDYLARDSASAWALALRRELGVGAR